MGRQMREENGFVGPIIEHTEVAGIGPRMVTRENQEHPEAKGQEWKDLRPDSLTNTSEMVDAGLRSAFANAIANRHEPHARRHHCRSHNQLLLLLNTDVLSP
jgi:hypothetical protein